MSALPQRAQLAFTKVLVLQNTLATQPLTFMMLPS